MPGDGSILTLAAVSALALGAVLRRSSLRVNSGDLPFVAAHAYAKGPVRDVAHALKRPAHHPRELARAAQQLAALVPAGAVLVPVPSSDGSTAVNLALAEAIAVRSGARVCDALRRDRAVQSSRARRKRGGRSLMVQQHQIREIARCPGDLYLVDNVIATGNTIRAARTALGRGVGLVWAVDLDVLRRAKAQHA